MHPNAFLAHLLYGIALCAITVVQCLLALSVARTSRHVRARWLSEVAWASLPAMLLVGLLVLTFGALPA